MKPKTLGGLPQSALRLWARPFALVIATAVVVGVSAACSSSSSPAKSVSPSDPAVPSVSSTAPATGSETTRSSPNSDSPSTTTTSIQQTVDSAWLNYWKVSLALTKHPRTEWPSRVKAVAVDPIYAQLLNSIRVQQDKLGQVGYGYVISHPYWPTPPTASSSRVVMGDCFDGSHAGTKLAKTGQVKTVGKQRTNIHATLVKGQDGKWRVHQIEYLKASC